MFLKVLWSVQNLEKGEQDKGYLSTAYSIKHTAHSKNVIHYLPGMGKFQCIFNRDKKKMVKKNLT